MAKHNRISRKLARVFILQLSFISVAALLGVVAARYVLGGILIQQALRDEADYFWNRFVKDPGCALPDTHNMKAYLSPRQAEAGMPHEIRGLTEGFHEIPHEHSFKVAYVTSRDNARLYLVFDGHRVEELALYFGMIPLAAGLVGIYIATFIGYRLSHTAVSPILQLALKVDQIERGSPDKSLQSLRDFPEAEDQEVQVLSQALARLAGRILRFIERERTFTRDVSHELRSPITVIRMATDVLLADLQLSAPSRLTLERIKRAVHDMEELTQAFLLLSRESEQGMPGQTVCVNDVVADEIERSRPLLEGKPVEVSMTASGRLSLTASEKALSVLIGNLVRNAFTYTEKGHVRIVIGAKELCIEDSGTGIAEDQMTKIFQPHFRATDRGSGHGVGLTIVKRLSDRFGWPVRFASREGLGTTVTVVFDQSDFEAGGVAAS
jgi:signal transduction histidine kinase